MRDPEIVEEELADIAAIQDDITKAERIVTWSAMHPDEVAFALRFFRGRSTGLDNWLKHHSDKLDNA